MIHNITTFDDCDLYRECRLLHKAVNTNSRQAKENNSVVKCECNYLLNEYILKPLTHQIECFSSNSSKYKKHTKLHLLLIIYLFILIRMNALNVIFYILTKHFYKSNMIYKAHNTIMTDKDYSRFLSLFNYICLNNTGKFILKESFIKLII